ncbi:uncharacterized protein PV07_08752 [Cladophialophora immunda]|uniref:Uncharacterized protein n=1 Tax=Cladophialophora immunda TaxID=569365 RepID=A0A0D1ZCW9_9EURO|nr:uncharacterized protein PV07_08752 [Cladophialophora immunda]KIW25586.1 hypothetical protein PV07_08752 [Cladophialophora immunda]
MEGLPDAVQVDKTRGHDTDVEKLVGGEPDVEFARPFGFGKPGDEECRAHAVQHTLEEPVRHTGPHLHLSLAVPAQALDNWLKPGERRADERISPMRSKLQTLKLSMQDESRGLELRCQCSQGATQDSRHAASGTLACGSTRTREHRDDGGVDLNGECHVVSHQCLRVKEIKVKVPDRLTEDQADGWDKVRIDIDRFVVDLAQ